MEGDGANGSRQIKVWDPAVRVFHWSFAATIAAAWLTHESSIPGLHEWLGYAALALAVLRIGWGFVGPQHARFADFVRSPRVILAYAVASLRGREQRFLGHNPLGGLMVLALLWLALGVGITGHLMTTRAFFGVAWMEETHEVFSNLFLVAVPLHVAGVVWESLRHRENLVTAMVTGRKRSDDAGTRERAEKSPSAAQERSSHKAVLRSRDGAPQARNPGRR